MIQEVGAKGTDIEMKTINTWLQALEDWLAIT